MGYFITVLVVTTIASGVMLFVLKAIINLELYATSWTYGLLRTGMVLLTIPLFFLVAAYLAYLAMPTKIMCYQPDFDFIYESSYWRLRGSSFQKPYMRILIMVWLFGVTVKTIYCFIQVFRFHRDVIKTSLPVTDPDILQTVQQIRKDLNIAAEVSARQHPIIKNPILVVINKPIIFVGSADFSQKEYAYMIRHELIHLKKKHIFFKRLGVAIQIIYWFNPFLPAFFQFFSDYCELDCDREVLENCTSRQRLFYAELLLKLTPTNVPRNPGIESTFLGRRHPKILERRIQNIMRKPKIKTRSSIIALSVCYLLACPVIAYGATKGGADLADELLRKTSGEKTIENQVSKVYSLTTEREYEIETVLEGNFRGTSSVDQWISAGKAVSIPVITASSSIKVFLGSDSRSDTFRVTFNGQGADSSGGTISCTFDAEENQSYTLDIVNTSSHSIHVTGNIYN